jgi:C_GCAxxG_C_C family probable redox protein
MRDDNIFKAVSGLAGGVGLMGDTCGALLGASMMLGLKYGREREEIGNFDKLKSSSVPVGKLYKWFEKEFGSATCHDIRTKFGGGAYYDFSVPWQRELAEEARMFEKCSDLVGKTAARTAEMLWDAIEEEKKGNHK